MKKTLIIIEEIGNMTTSGAIVNWNLSKVLSEILKEIDILTLDTIDDSFVKEWSFGRVYTHPKENLTEIQKFLLRIPKLRALFQIAIGHDFKHYNRTRNIRRFLNDHHQNYDTVLLLSAGAGFTPHHAINSGNFAFKKIAVIHDPYPYSSYPKEYRCNNKFIEFFSLKNQQKMFNKVNHIVFPSLRLYQWYLNDYSIDDKKVKIIPHAVNFKEQEPEKKENDSISIIHTGTLLKQRNPYIFLKTINEQSAHNVKVAFYGGFSVESEEEQKEIQSFEFVEVNNIRISYELALKKLAGSDFLLLIESKDKDNPFLPTKFVDYVNTGKPIIALTSANSEVARLLGEDYPLLSHPSDKEKISSIINDYIRNPDVIKKSLNRIQELKVYFSQENILNSYKELLKK